MDPNVKENLFSLYREWKNETPQKIETLPAHGSYRQYYRIYGKSDTAIGAYNEDKAENRAFLSFSDHFYKQGLAVPQIYGFNEKEMVYLEQDLGDTTLFSFLTEKRRDNEFTPEILKVYEKTIGALPLFQIKAAKELDYSVCYPRHSFDKQSMMWDLNYFKYYFLKLAKIAFDEQKLEDDFETFTAFLLSAERSFFLYRDFQSRNVMLVKGEPYFIDYQGGRKGALHYDVASLLYDAKAAIPDDVRNGLLEHYIEEASKHTKIHRESFLEHYYGFVFIRIMQALGAYGFRGFYERKTHFLKSVPYAIQNLENLLHRIKLPVEIPSLIKAWSLLVQSTLLRQLGDADLQLKVRIQSFSYKRGIPWDERGHGGGFVFDCRALPNPGRQPEYATSTGNDDDVIEYFKDKEGVHSFLANIYKMVDQVVTNYQQRNFSDLMIAFGCTGGQHRSVYCSNKLAAYLKEKHDLEVEIRHRELEMK